MAEDYDPSDRVAVMNYLQEHKARGEIVTGLLYVDEEADDLHGYLDSVDVPFNALSDADLVPGAAALAKLNASLR